MGAELATSRHMPTLTIGSYNVDVSTFYLGDVGGADGSTRADSGARDAALAANSFAERTAKQGSEYQSAWRAGAEWRELWQVDGRV